jgi:hypothetical protein
MHHFTGEAHSDWGIEEEYPDGGVNLEAHPRGYDTTTRQFRSWHNPWTGEPKRDPMNGGESSNSETCFPGQFTAYHAKKMQEWALTSPLLLSSDDGTLSPSRSSTSGVYLYNSLENVYDPISNAQLGELDLTKSTMMANLVGVPVATLMGTIASNNDACQIYPPVRSRAGNTFDLASPFDPSIRGTHWPSFSVYSGAAYFLQIHFEDGTSDFALIAVPLLAESDMSLHSFSLNVALARNPISIDLLRFAQGSWPDVDATSETTLLHSQEIGSFAPENIHGLPGVVRVGRGWLGASAERESVVLRAFCVSSANCYDTSATLSWRGAQGASLKYLIAVGSTTSPIYTTPTATALRVLVVREEDDTQHYATVFGSRFVDEESGGTNPWTANVPLTVVHTGEQPPPDAVNGARFWMSYYENSHLETGTYHTISDNGVSVQALMPSGDVWCDAFVRTSFTIKEPTEVVEVSFSDTSWTSTTSFEALDSSMVFLALDPSIGPTVREWWGGTSARLSVPLFSSCSDDDVNEPVSVIATFMAQQFACGAAWQMNAGRSASNCAHSLVLTLDGSVGVNPWRDDPNFRAGCNFHTHAAKPVVIEARRWHDPSAKLLLGELVLDITVTF